MKTLLVTTEFPPFHGGVAQYYSGLAHALSGTIDVFLPHDLSSASSDDMLVLRKRFFLRWIWPHWTPLFFHLWKIVRKRTYAIIFAGHILPIGTALYLVSRFFPHVRFGVFLHGLDILLAQQSRWKRWLTRRILDRATCIITNSHFVKEQVVHLGISGEKISVLHPGIDTMKAQKHKNIKATLQRRYQLEGKIVLLTVARLVERKGIDLVLDALQKMNRQDIAYIIVGDGSQKKNLQSFVTRYVLPVTFVGSVDQDELSFWYETCDIFIMTPQQSGPDVEGFGMVYLEANAHGKPVIGSRSGGVSEAIVDGETGILVPEGDVGAIASAIRTLIDDKVLRERLGMQGKQRVTREFQWQQRREEFMNILSKHGLA